MNILFSFSLFRIGQQWGGIGWLPVVACGGSPNMVHLGTRGLGKNSKVKGYSILFDFF
jgi:hypothetical protein